MNVYGIKNHAVLFSQLEDIQPIPETVKMLLDVFHDKGLVPNVVQSFGPNGPVNSVNLTNKDNSWSIVFGRDRLEIVNINRDINVSNFCKDNDFIIELLDIVKKILNMFQKKFNRLSLISQTFITDLSNEELFDISKQLFNVHSTYKTLPPVEWSQRIVSRANIDVNGKQEACNIITNLRKASGELTINSKSETWSGIDLQFDINTFQMNNIYRFNFAEIKSFFTIISNMSKEMKTDFIKEAILHE